MSIRFFVIASITLVATAPAFALPASPASNRATSAMKQVAPPTSSALRSGIYILDRFDTAEITPADSDAPISTLDGDADSSAQAAVGVLGAMASGVARELETHIEAAARAGWIEIDAETRQARFPLAHTDTPNLATFSADFTRLVPDTDPDEVMAIEVLGPDRFVQAVRILGTHRMTWRRIEPDDPALIRLQRDRDQARQARTREEDGERAQLEALARTPVALDLRRSLPDGGASIALPAQAGLRGFHGHYGVSSLGHSVEIIVPEDVARADAMLEDAIAQFERNTTVAVTLEDGIQVARDRFEGYRAVARKDYGGQAYLLTAQVDTAELPQVIAVWRSLDAPVEHPVPLRVPDVGPPAHLSSAQAFDTALDAAFAELLAPEQLIGRRHFQHDSTSDWGAPRIDLQTDGVQPLRVAVDLAEGDAQTVLDAFTRHPFQTGIGLAFDAQGCRAVATLPVDLGHRRRPFALVLRQTDNGNYARCLSAAAALSTFDRERIRSTRVSRTLLEQFGAYTQVRPQTDGTLHVRGADGMGVVAADGRVVVTPEHERLSTRGQMPGYIVRHDNTLGLLDKTGRRLLPTRFDSIERRGEALAVEQDGKRAAYTLAGHALTGFDYDRIHVLADGQLLQLYQDDRRAVLDPATGRILVPLDAGVTNINTIRDQPRFIARRPDGHALYDLSGRVLIEGVHNIKLVGTRMVAVRADAGGHYVLHDLDGQRLSDTPYETVSFNNARQLIRVRGTDGLNRLLDTELKPRSPAGYDVVFAPGEDGTIVIADDHEPRRMGMAGPDLELVLPAIYRAVFSMREGLIVAQTAEGLWGAWNASGEPVLDAEWDTLSQSFGGTLYAERDGLWRAIDHTGAARDARRWSALKLHHRNIGNAAPFATARINGTAHDGEWEVLDMTGSRVLDGTFDAKADIARGVRLSRDGEDVVHPAP